MYSNRTSNNNSSYRKNNIHDGNSTTHNNPVTVTVRVTVTCKVTTISNKKAATANINHNKTRPNHTKDHQTSEMLESEICVEERVYAGGLGRPAGSQLWNGNANQGRKTEST